MSNPFKNIQGETAWRAPSNIALVKYWGKYGIQLPKNASISFTLNNAFTETSVKYVAKTTDDKQLDINFFLKDRKIQNLPIKSKNFWKASFRIFHFCPIFR
jgi:diphosphomevalonate decarboxylase